MDLIKLQILLSEHKERFLRKDKLIHRDILKQIKIFLKQREIVVITGVRRSGKSSLMKLIANNLIKDKIPKSNILYINFEDERFTEFTYQDFDKLYAVFQDLESPKNGKCYLFLDEIQAVDGWERWLNRLYEFENVKIFITGSNASILSSEASSALTGRNRQITNFPFSFREFLSFKKPSIVGNLDKAFMQKQSLSVIKSEFKEYLKLGGFPEVVKNGDNTLLEQYFKDILYRDIISRYSIRNIKELKNLCLFLSSNISSLYSYQNIQKITSANNINTIKNYLDRLEEVFLFFRLNLFDFSVKRQIYNPSKIYSVDHALNNAISFNFSENIGHIYENIVFTELMRKGTEIYYWKSHEGLEVDFITKKGINLLDAIQVCYSLSDPFTKRREIYSLVYAQRQLNIKNLLILSNEDDEKEEIYENMKIHFMPIWKWLLI